MDAVWKESLERGQQSALSRLRQRVASDQGAQARHVSFTPYVPPFLVALLKDLLDLTGIGSLPGIGTLITFCFSILIFLLLMTAGSGQSYSLAKKGLLLAAGTVAEGIFFGLNFLPIETITVFFIYRGDKKASIKS